MLSDVMSISDCGDRQINCAYMDRDCLVDQQETDSILHLLWTDGQTDRQTRQTRQTSTGDHSVDTIIILFIIEIRNQGPPRTDIIVALE